MAVMVSKTYTFRSTTVPQMLERDHRVNFSNLELHSLKSLASRLNSNRERIDLFSSSMLLPTVLKERENNPEETERILHSFHTLLQKHTVPAAWYIELGEVAQELGVPLSNSFKLAVNYAEGLVGAKMEQDTYFNWHDLESAGQLEYVPF